MSNKSEVESFWEAIAAKAGDKRTWHDLRTQEQHVLITGINMILQVLQIKKPQG